MATSVDDTGPESENGFDMGDPELNRHPQPGYRMLRDSGPVVRLPGVIPSRANADAHLVGRHADVVTVLRSPDVFSSRFDAVHIGQVRPLIPLQIDPPDHAKYRKLLDPLFAPRRIALLEDRTRALVSDLVEAVDDDRQGSFAGSPEGLLGRRTQGHAGANPAATLSRRA